MGRKRMRNGVSYLPPNPLLLFVCLSGFTVLWFNDVLTLVGHFVSSPREGEKRERKDRSGDERKGRGRKRKRNESEEREEKTKQNNIPFYPYLLQG